MRQKELMSNANRNGKDRAVASRPRDVVALFAGVGGIESGLKRAGYRTRLLCENDPGAGAVLRARFRGVPLVEDVRELAGDPKALPDRIDLLTAGFPCQDLSQAGGTAGIRGAKSGLVTHVFDILEHRIEEERPIPWVFVENVPFMLQLARGAAMAHVVGEFERLGYRWAYRVVDTRAFGLPQRRERVLLVASLVADPVDVLFAEDAGAPPDLDYRGRACGFYWTEGNRGLGWAVDAVPTLKGGSTVGIPSPPGIWMPDGRIVTPDIRDAERLQGFPAGWTEPAATVGRPSYRWKLVGNAVTVDVAEWVGRAIARPGVGSRASSHLFPMPSTLAGAWPRAARGSAEGRYEVSISSWPVRVEGPSLTAFLEHETKPLSFKAANGFKTRLDKSCLRRPKEFDRDLALHVARMEAASVGEAVEEGVEVAVG
jgi:DNA (cytosine-5)-methyltransferase 1